MCFQRLKRMRWLPDIPSFALCERLFAQVRKIEGPSPLCNVKPRSTLSEQNSQRRANFHVVEPNFATSSPVRRCRNKIHNVEPTFTLSNQISQRQAPSDVVGAKFTTSGQLSRCRTKFQNRYQFSVGLRIVDSFPCRRRFSLFRIHSRPRSAPYLRLHPHCRAA